MRAYSLDLRQRIVAAVQAGRNRSEVARLFGVSRRTVGRFLVQLNDRQPFTPFQNAQALDSPIH